MLPFLLSQSDIHLYMPKYHKMLAILLTLSLVSIQFTAGFEPCRVRGILTNGLKCGDQFYTRSDSFVNAIKSCSSGSQVGDLLTLKMAKCTFASYNVTADGSNPFYERVNSFSQDFGAHGPQLRDSALECLLAAKDDPPESTRVVECASEGYQKICGSKTCNWLNNVD